jgi:hypothetical protein
LFDLVDDVAAAHFERLSNWTILRLHENISSLNMIRT